MNPESLVQRVQSALGSRYQVDRELSVNPGTALFLAIDLSLRRTVAVKVIDRATAGEALARQFRHEARMLAGLSHPNITAIHDIGDREGLLYYVRDYLPGEPLSHRLERGRMAAAEAVRLGLDLLGAIGAAHRTGVSWLSVEPENIVCLPDRFVLTDFEITLSPNSTVSASASTVEPGTEAIGQSDDLYLTAALIYQALTGREWPGADSPRLTRWAGVPGRLRAPLERALQPNRAKRWANSRSFAQSLEAVATQSSRGRRLLTSAATVTLLLAAWAWWPAKAGRPPLPVPRELAIVPFESAEGSTDGADLAHLLQLNLDNLPGLSLTSARRINRWWDHRGRAPLAGEKAQIARELRAHWVTHGILERYSDSLRVRVSLYDGQGRVTPLPEMRSHASDLGALSDTLALALLRTIAPELAGSYQVIGDLAGIPLPALRQFLQGDEAFQRDQWALAEQHFEAALALDSSFALAAWRLANVRGWRRLGSAEDLTPLYQRRGTRLRPLDALLIDALSQLSLRTRFERLEAAIARFPDDAYARLLYAEELFHRGPLVGRGLDEGVRAMAGAIALDSLLALAYDHLVFASIRIGDKSSAKQLLSLRQGIGSNPSPGDPDVVALSRLAYDERFAPARAWLQLRLLSWTGDSAQLDGVSRLFRTGVSWFDLPESQLSLASLLLKTGKPDSVRRAGAYIGQALALTALGRPAQAATELDAGLNLLGGPEARVERAEWRVVLPALGLVPPAGAQEAEIELAAVADSTALGRRAAWALALAAYSRADTVRLEQWRTRLRPPGDSAQPLERFALAMSLAARKRWKPAQAVAESLETSVNLARPGDPFVRSAFHLLRGDWFLASGDSARALQEWGWHENTDIVGWPSGFPEAGEIDGMFGVMARLRQSRLLRRSGASPEERRSGCAMALRVVELWSNAEPVMSRLLEEARTLARSCRE
jgi:serine/threonine protein kinase